VDPNPVDKLTLLPVVLSQALLLFSVALTADITPATIVVVPTGTVHKPTLGWLTRHDFS
jgi:hypothetical protein